MHAHHTHTHAHVTSERTHTNDKAHKNTSYTHVGINTKTHRLSQQQNSVHCVPQRHPMQQSPTNGRASTLEWSVRVQPRAGLRMHSRRSCVGVKQCCFQKWCCFTLAYRDAPLGPLAANFRTRPVRHLLHTDLSLFII